MTSLIERYHNWRRRTFPATRDDLAWRHEALLSELRALKRSSHGGAYYYLGDHWGLTTLANGLPFFVNTRDRHVAPWIILRGKWEDANDDIMQELVCAGDTCFDIGANLGYFTIRLAHKVGRTGKVIAFEPNPELFIFLKESVVINGFDERVVLYQNAVGSAPASGELSFNYSNMGGGRIVNVSQQSAGNIEVLAIDAIADIPEKVDFIKMDIEGMEVEAFYGMSKLLEKNLHCAIICEYNYSAWEKHGQPDKILHDIAGKRSIFLLPGDGTISKSVEILKRDLGPNSYVLMIEEACPSFDRIRHRLR